MAVRADATRVLLNVDAQDWRRSDRTAALGRAGYTVVEAVSESQAIRAVVHHDVALVLLDGDPPQGNLAALAGTLQRMRPTMAVLVIPATCPAQVQWPDDGLSPHGSDEARLIAAVGRALQKDDGPDDCCDPEVVTDVCGRIQGTSDNGARLLNGKARGRDLVTFFDAGRDVWREAVRRASAGEPVELTGRLRPKERRPLSVSVRITSRAGAAGVTLEWTIAPL